VLSLARDGEYSSHRRDCGLPNYVRDGLHFERAGRRGKKRLAQVPTALASAVRWVGVFCKVTRRLRPLWIRRANIATRRDKSSRTRGPLTIGSSSGASRASRSRNDFSKRASARSIWMPDCSEPRSPAETDRVRAHRSRRPGVWEICVWTPCSLPHTPQPMPVGKVTLRQSRPPMAKRPGVRLAKE
jgi:hypothetical protein